MEGEVKSGHYLNPRPAKVCFIASLQLGQESDGEVTKLPNAQYQDPGFSNLYIATFGISPRNTKYALHSTKPVRKTVKNFEKQSIAIIIIMTKALENYKTNKRSHI